ncbi:MAG TPA: hypothetical protein VJZ91_17475 [Blastocatellia bacterium]|nr:hypothetical protein [Blastocatellia bacterium]
MKTHALKSSVGFLLLLLALTAFSFSNFAVFGASEASEPTTVNDLPAFEETTGTLTAKGQVLLNGQYIRSGVTVVNGSVIQTDTGAHAMIEAGPLGRVDLDQITGILLTYGERSVQASLTKCGNGVTLNLPPGVSGLVKVVHISDVGVFSEHRDLDVKVYRGEVLVKYGQGKERIMKAGDHRDFDNATEVSASGDAVYKVYCDEDHVVPLLGLPALALPFLATGAAAAVPPFLSQLQP